MAHVQNLTFRAVRNFLVVLFLNGNSLPASDTEGDVYTTRWRKSSESPTQGSVCSKHAGNVPGWEWINDQHVYSMSRAREEIP